MGTGPLLKKEGTVFLFWSNIGEYQPIWIPLKSVIQKKYERY